MCDRLDHANHNSGGHHDAHPEVHQSGQPEVRAELLAMLAADQEDRLGEGGEGWATTWLVRRGWGGSSLSTAGRPARWSVTTVPRWRGRSLSTVTSIRRSSRRCWR